MLIWTLVLNFAVASITAPVGGPLITYPISFIGNMWISVKFNKLLTALGDTVDDQKSVIDTLVSYNPCVDPLT